MASRTTGTAAAGGADPRALHAALDGALSQLLAALDELRRAGGGVDRAAQSVASITAAAAALPPDSGWRPPGALAERLWRHACDGPGDAAQAASSVLADLCQRSGLQQQLLTRRAVDALAAALLAADSAAAAASHEAAGDGPVDVPWSLAGCNLAAVLGRTLFGPRPEDTRSTAALREELRGRALAAPGVAAAMLRAAVPNEQAQARAAARAMSTAGAAARAPRLASYSPEFDVPADVLTRLQPAAAAPLLPAAAAVAAARRARILEAEGGGGGGGGGGGASGSARGPARAAAAAAVPLPPPTARVWAPFSGDAALRLAICVVAVGGKAGADALLSAGDGDGIGRGGDGPPACPIVAAALRRAAAPPECDECSGGPDAALVGRGRACELITLLVIRDAARTIAALPGGVPAAARTLVGVMAASAPRMGENGAHMAAAGHASGTLALLTAAEAGRLLGGGELDYCSIVSAANGTAGGTGSGSPAAAPVPSVAHVPGSAATFVAVLRGAVAFNSAVRRDAAYVAAAGLNAADASRELSALQAMMRASIKCAVSLAEIAFLHAHRSAAIGGEAAMAWIASFVSLGGAGPLRAILAVAGGHEDCAFIRTAVGLFESLEPKAAMLLAASAGQHSASAGQQGSRDAQPAQQQQEQPQQERQQRSQQQRSPPQEQPQQERQQQQQQQQQGERRADAPRPRLVWPSCWSAAAAAASGTAPTAAAPPRAGRRGTGSSARRCGSSGTRRAARRRRPAVGRVAQPGRSRAAG
jgi:hypothetical protein